MITADWITLGILVLFALIGVIAGFGGGLKFFTSGIFGIVIAVFLCYCLGGFVLEIKFVQNLLGKFAALWVDKEGFFYDFLTKIHLEIIVYYIVLFILVLIVRKIIVIILKNIFEIKVLPMKIVNRILGIALFVGMAVLLALFVLQIIRWVGGSTEADVLNFFNGSALKLDKLYLENPLNTIIEQVRGYFN